MNSLRPYEPQNLAFPHGYPLEGEMVNYWVDPTNAVGNEPFGHLTGMVISGNGFNSSGMQNVLVCPAGEDGFSYPELAIQSPEQPLMFRPDLSTHVVIKNLRPVPHNGKATVCSLNFVRQAQSRFLDLIQPAPTERLSWQFISKGVFGWFDTLPFIKTGPFQNHASPAAGLTPLSIAQKTGMVIVAKSYTGFAGYSPRMNVPILSARRYLPSFVDAANLQAVSLKRLSIGNSELPVLLPRATMAELCEKIAATITYDAYSRVRAKYPGKKGDLSPAIRRALDHWASQVWEQQGRPYGLRP